VNMYICCFKISWEWGSKVSWYVSFLVSGIQSQSSPGSWTFPMLLITHLDVLDSNRRD